MKPELQIIELAKLDGNTLIPHKPTPQEIASGCYFQWEPDYLHSRDAIVPLIKKQGKEMGEQVIINLAHKLGIDSDWSEIAASLMILLATPQQLSEALLRACGKWKE